MNKAEAAIEAAKHMGFYKLMADRAYANGQIAHMYIKDAVQDMYIAACTSLQSFDPTKSKVTSYLTQPCRRVLRDLSTSNRLANNPGAIAEKAYAMRGSETPARHSIEMPTSIEPFMDYLGKQERDYIRLRAKGKTYAEIAAEHRVTHQWVHDVIKSAYKAIRLGKRSPNREIEDGVYVAGTASMSPNAKHAKAYRTRQQLKVAA